MDMNGSALREWAEEEQAYLWHDLDHDIRFAINGTWSIAAASTALRIGKIAKILGPTPYGEVPWTLLAGRVYETVLKVVGVEPVLPDEDEWKRFDESMKDHGGTLTELRDRYQATAEVIESPRESEFIRDYGVASSST